MLFDDAFGDSIHFSDGTNMSKLGAIKNIETGECFKLEGVMETGYLFDVNKYLTEFIIPENVPEGKYNIYMNLGRCGRYGWSEPFLIEIKNDNSLNHYFRTKWNRQSGLDVKMPECDIITITADDPSPIADYTDKIQSALDSLTDGRIVALGYGTFPISAPLKIRNNVVLMGAGNATVLRASESKIFKDGIPQDAVFAAKKNGLRGWANDYIEHLARHKLGIGVRLCSGAGVESLKIELGGGLNVGVFVVDDQKQLAENVFINKVEVDGCGLTELENDGFFGAANAGIVCAALTKDMVIWNCKGSALQPITVFPARHTFAKIINNEFYCRPRQLNESMIAGLRYSIVSNNLFADGRRSFVGNQGLSHNWIYQNRSTGVDRADCALEAYMSEHGNGEWSGHGVAFGVDFVDIECNYDIMKLSRGVDYKERLYHYQRFLFIFDGRGFSQYRKIEDVIEDGAKKRLILDKPWDVIPDETSALSILFGTHHNLWVDNNTSLSNGHSQFVWGCGFENVVAGHCMELSAGIRFQSYHLYNDVSSDLLINAGYEKTVTKAISVGVLAFNKIIRCQTKASGMAIRMQANTIPNEDPEIWREFNKTRGVFGNTIKSCAFDGSCDALNYAKNLHQLKPITSGILLDGAYNRIVDNYLFAFKKPIAFLNSCEGNMVSRNEFRGEERVICEGKVYGRDVK